MKQGLPVSVWQLMAKAGLISCALLGTMYAFIFLLISFMRLFV